jgi:hypothetical protein
MVASVMSIRARSERGIKAINSRFEADSPARLQWN